MRHFGALPCIISLLLMAFSGYPQAPDKPISGIRTDIEKVINDYPNQFKNLAGEPLIQNPQTAQYGSIVCPAGANQCIVTKYSSGKKEIYSWEAAFYPIEDFSKAKQKFKEFYNQLNTLVFSSGDKKYSLSSPYKEPDESLRFHSIIFSSSSKDKAVKNLKVELLLEADMLEWTIRILVYDKEREDDERGESRES